jgi:hypothetical protein
MTGRIQIGSAPSIDEDLHPLKARIRRALAKANPMRIANVEQGNPDYYVRYAHTVGVALWEYYENRKVIPSLSVVMFNLLQAFKHSQMPGEWNPLKTAQAILPLSPDILQLEVNNRYIV